MKKMKRISAFLMTVIMMLGLSATALAADASVTYEGGAEKYVFLPGSEYTDTDLFDNFKGVMPGDEITQKVMIKNESGDHDYVKIYMRAVAHDEEANPLSEKVSEAGETVASMSDFLSQLSMTVKNGDEIIYQASPDELDGLKDNVLLGEFEKGEGTELEVVLSVPIELGNEYANRIGEVDWVFVAEEMNNPKTPDTGDHVNVWSYIILMAVSFIGVIFLIIKKRQIM